MKILLYNNGQIKLYPQGYEIDGVLQPLGEIQTGVHHLEMVTTEQPEFNPVTQYVTHEFLPDFDENEYKQVWTIHNYTDYEIAMRDWAYPEFLKKIIAPISLIFEGTGLAMKAWFDLNDLPIKKVGNTVELYCNEILPAHADIVTQLQGVITIEDRPTKEIIQQ